MAKKSGTGPNMGRRGFLKSGATVIPALAVVGLAIGSAPPARADCFGSCHADCADSCVESCKGDCMGDCKGKCGGCDDTCTGSSKG